MSRHSGSNSFSQQQSPPPSSTKQFPAAHSSSSAFSASANPNEDWTKITDLAERRRIQNRIAQRNYRKKLKKRLEDLERRAGSSSASPEPRYGELAPTETDSSGPSSHLTSGQRSRSSSSINRRDRTPDNLTQNYMLPSDDRSMFSQQYTRQLSTSPPPFSYARTISTDGYAADPYCTSTSVGMGMSTYPQYLLPAIQPHQHQHPYASAQHMPSPPIKQELFADDDISPFSMGYASMAAGGSDSTSAAVSNSYYGSIPAYPQTSSLLLSSKEDSFESYSRSYGQASPPPELCWLPRTPASMPRTPPMDVHDGTM